LWVTEGRKQTAGDEGEMKREAAMQVEEIEGMLRETLAVAAEVRERAEGAGGGDGGREDFPG
jgi:hypothetical protein